VNVSDGSARAQNPSIWIPRATRLRVGAPVAYRTIFEERWKAGSTIDISRTGVLFRPAEEVPVGTDLQLVIYLSKAPLEVDGAALPTPDLYCGGRVARTAEADGRPAVAIQIDFEWAEAPPGRLWETGLGH
jgi:PilZ domain-containing protein